MNPTAAAVADKLTGEHTEIFVVVDESKGEKYYPSPHWTLAGARENLREKVIAFYEGREKAEQYVDDWKSEDKPDFFADAFVEGECYVIYTNVRILS